MPRQQGLGGGAGANDLDQGLDQRHRDQARHQATPPYLALAADQRPTAEGRRAGREPVGNVRIGHFTACPPIATVKPTQADAARRQLSQPWQRERIGRKWLQRPEQRTGRPRW